MEEIRNSEPLNTYWYIVTEPIYNVNTVVAPIYLGPWYSRAKICEIVGSYRSAWLGEAEGAQFLAKEPAHATFDAQSMRHGSTGALPHAAVHRRGLCAQQPEARQTILAAGGKELVNVPSIHTHRIYDISRTIEIAAARAFQQNIKTEVVVYSIILPPFPPHKSPQTKPYTYIRPLPCPI